MTNTSRFLMGAVLGGIVGWLIGEVIADHFSPEYFTEEELSDMGMLASEYNVNSDEEDAPNQTSNRKVGKTVMGQKHDYTKHFKGEPNPPLEKLTKKYNLGEVDDEEEDLSEKYLEKIDSELTDYLDDLNIEDDPESYLDGRDKENPYIMTAEEWAAEETDFARVTLLYFSEDDVLTDENNRALPSVEKIIGPDALSHFGTFSDDDHIVYVCNPRTKAEYEIVLNEGAYADTLTPGKSRSKKKTTRGIVHNVFDDEEDETIGG